jgi:hypothetical protein
VLGNIIAEETNKRAKYHNLFPSSPINFSTQRQMRKRRKESWNNFIILKEKKLVEIVITIHV